MNKPRLTTILLLLGCWLQAFSQQPILGGELSNSATTCTEDIDEVMPRMAALGLNTVLVPAYWEFLEPQEGQFDYTLIDRTIDRARENNLKVVFLWFGVWKNSMSCYAPLWFKQDTRRFPRARTATGKPLEIASAFSDEVLEADRRAFAALMRRIAERGRDVVTMVQVENEIGMLEDARDHSPLAEAAYAKGVPQELQLPPTSPYWERLQAHRNTPSSWRGQGGGSGAPSWTSVFGDTIYTDEIFMAYYYAKYVEQLCQTAHSIISDMPLYVNAALNSRGRQPGQYPSGGPLAHLIDIWHAAAPSLLLLAPDIYDTGFKDWVSQYALSNNRLFIPESRCCENSGVRALYVFGEHQALGFSPFAIDQASPRETENITKAYALLRQISNLKEKVNPNANNAPLGPQGRLPKQEPSWGLLFDQQDKERIIEDDELIITCRHYFTLPWDSRATDGSTWPEGGAMLIKLAKDEYLLAGSGIVVEFKTKAEKALEQQVVLGEDGFVANVNVNDNVNAQSSTFNTPLGPQGRLPEQERSGIGFVDEVEVQPDGTLKYLRRHNGDQDHQGRHARISVGDWKVLHIQLYRYE